MFTKTVEHDIMQCAGACALMNNTCNAMHFEASNNTCSLAEVGEKLWNILIIILKMATFDFNWILAFRNAQSKSPNYLIPKLKQLYSYHTFTICFAVDSTWGTTRGGSISGIHGNSSVKISGKLVKKWFCLMMCMMWKGLI